MAELRVIEPEDGERLEEAMLIARIRARDVRAFEAFYKAQHHRLARFLGNLLRRPHLTEEVLGDTMMAVWERIDTFRGDSRLSTWMFGIAYRQAMNALRRLDEPADDAAAEADQPSEAPGPDEIAGCATIAEALAAAVAGLSPVHRAVITLTYQQELGYREIATVLDCPVDTVKTRMFHARRHLRQALGDRADWL